MRFVLQTAARATWRFSIFSALSGCLCLVPALTSCWPGLNKVEKMWRDAEIHHLARTVLINKVLDSSTLTPCLLRYQFYTGEKIGKSFQQFFCIFFFLLVCLFSSPDKELQLSLFQAVFVCAGNCGVHTCLLIVPPPWNRGSSSTFPLISPLEFLRTSSLRGIRDLNQPPAPILHQAGRGWARSPGAVCVITALSKSEQLTETLLSPWLHRDVSKTGECAVLSLLRVRNGLCDLLSFCFSLSHCKQPCW